MSIKNLISQFIKEAIAEGLTVNPLDYREKGVVPQLVRDPSPGGVGFTALGTKPSIRQIDAKQKSLAREQQLINYSVPYIKNVELNVSKFNEKGDKITVLKSVPVSSVFSVDFDDRELRTATLKAIKQFANDYPEQIKDILERAAGFAVDSLVFLDAFDGGITPDVIVTPQSSSTLAKQFARIVSQKYNATYLELDINREARFVEDTIEKNRNLVVNDDLIRLKTKKLDYDKVTREEQAARDAAYAELHDDVTRMVNTANRRIARELARDPSYMPSWSALLDKRLSRYVIGGFDFNKPKDITLPDGRTVPGKKLGIAGIKKFTDANKNSVERELGELMGLDVLIVDELVSYGMTFREVARTLYNAGANTVSGLTIWKNSGSKKSPQAPQPTPAKSVDSTTAVTFEVANEEDLEYLADMIVSNKKLPTATWAKYFAKDNEIKITDEQAERVADMAKSLLGK